MRDNTRKRKRNPLKSYFQQAIYRSWRNKLFDNDNAGKRAYRNFKRGLKHYERLEINVQINDYYINEFLV